MISSTHFGFFITYIVYIFFFHHRIVWSSLERHAVYGLIGWGVLKGELIRCQMANVVNSSCTNLPTERELSLYLISYLISQFLLTSSDAIGCVQDHLSFTLNQDPFPSPKFPRPIQSTASPLRYCLWVRSGRGTQGGGTRVVSIGRKMAWNEPGK